MLALYARNRDRRVIVGAGIGIDAAALDVGGQYVIVKTDPITFVMEETGAYALAINANDLATMGALTRWFLATILAPAGTTTGEEVSRIFSQIGSACHRLKISLCAVIRR